MLGVGTAASKGKALITRSKNVMKDLSKMIDSLTVSNEAMMAEDKVLEDQQAVIQKGRDELQDQCKSSTNLLNNLTKLFEPAE